MLHKSTAEVYNQIDGNYKLCIGWNKWIYIYVLSLTSIIGRNLHFYMQSKHSLLLLPHNIRMQYNCIRNVTWFITVNMCKFIYLIDLNVVTARLLIILIQIVITFSKSKWYILEWHGSYSTLLTRFIYIYIYIYMRVLCVYHIFYVAKCHLKYDYIWKICQGRYKWIHTHVILTIQCRVIRSV